MSRYRALAQRVVVAGGLLHVSVEELRDLEGAGKLGAHVRSDIERHLSNVELHLLEGRVPNDQRAKVWLVSRATAEGDLIWEAVAQIRRNQRGAA